MVLNDFSHKLDKMNTIIATTLKLVVGRCKLTLRRKCKVLKPDLNQTLIETWVKAIMFSFLLYIYRCSIRNVSKI